MPKCKNTFFKLFNGQLIAVKIAKDLFNLSITSSTKFGKIPREKRECVEIFVVIYIQLHFTLPNWCLSTRGICVFFRNRGISKAFIIKSVL